MSNRDAAIARIEARLNQIYQASIFTSYTQQQIRGCLADLATLKGE